MPSSTSLLTAATLVFSVAAAGASYAVAQDPQPTYPLKGTVYVETNSPETGQNAVLAFRRAPDGTLKPLNGSPFPTGGTGLTDPSYGLAVFSNDQPVIANSKHTLLFAVNEHSNSIAVFRIKADGGLKAVPGSPFASGGYQPVSLTLVGDVLTVANKNGDPGQANVEAGAKANYTTFTVAANGVLTPVTGGTVAAGASPSQVLAVPQDQYSAFSALGYGGSSSGDGLGYIFGADFGGGALQSYTVGKSGVLNANVPQAPPSYLYAGQTFLGGPAPALPLGLGVNPVFPLLYVGLVTINKVGVYVFTPGGQLIFIDAVDNPAPANCWILVNKEGTRMYTGDTLTNEITTYDIATNPLVPKALGTTQLQGTGRVFELALSSNEQYLYAVSQQAEATGSVDDNALHVLKLSNDGSTLSEVQTALLPDYVSDPPAGIRWQGVVAF